MFVLQNKTILIISPQKWGPMHVSKHHYAIELAKIGNKVFFLNPPDLNKTLFPVFEMQKDYPGLYIINYKPIYRAQRFLPEFIYQLLVLINIKLFLIKTGKIDIIWSFEDASFFRLDWFKAEVNIFHPVDLQETIGRTAKYADIIFSVSESILNCYKQFGKPMHFINHGLDEILENIALTKINTQETYKKPDIIKAGYVGNLFIEALDRVIFKNIIKQNPHVQFIFWGPYEKTQSNLGSWDREETINFIEFLKQQPNVELKGIKKQHEIYTDPLSPDLYLLFYNPTKSKVWDGSNSHKILEYLSTGKVVITHFVSTYFGNDNMIIMPENINENHSLPEIFTQVINNLEYYNSSVLAKTRITFTLNNTYSKQIGRIEKCINEIN
jgi:hypothetical protein